MVKTNLPTMYVRPRTTNATRGKEAHTSLNSKTLVRLGALKFQRLLAGKSKQSLRPYKIRAREHSSRISENNGRSLPDSQRT